MNDFLPVSIKMSSGGVGCVSGYERMLRKLAVDWSCGCSVGLRHSRRARLNKASPRIYSQRRDASQIERLSCPY